MVNLIKILLAIVLLSYAAIHISEPSNVHVLIALGEIIIAIVLLSGPIKQLLKNL